MIDAKLHGNDGHVGHRSFLLVIYLSLPPVSHPWELLPNPGTTDFSPMFHKIGARVATRIPCCTCLHLISKADYKYLLTNIKKYTKQNGYNIHAVITDTIEPPDDLKPLCKGLFKEREIFEYYKDWEIILKKTYILEDEHPGGIKHRHPINKIVARK